MCVSVRFFIYITDNTKKNKEKIINSEKILRKEMERGE